MARGINKVIIVGNVGKDPESRFMPNGKAVTNISVATSERWKDKNTGEQKEATEWHNVVFFDRLAEVANEYLKKGSQVYIEGKLQTRKWQDKDGKDRYTTEIVSHEMQMLGERPQGGGQPNRQQPQGGHSGQSRSGHTGQSSRPAPAPAQAAADFDDDIPF